MIANPAPGREREREGGEGLGGHFVYLSGCVLRCDAMQGAIGERMWILPVLQAAAPTSCLIPSTVPNVH
jgi:hypothetical protein